MSELSRISRLAGGLHVVASLVLVAVPLLVAVFLWRGWNDPSWLSAAFPALPEGTALTPMKSTLVIALGAVTLLPVAAALLHMRGLFSRYRQGEILTLPCARHILRAWQALVLLALVQFIILPVQIMVLTADNPAGERIVSLDFTSETLWLLLSGGLLVVIGWVMVEAARAAEENAGFI